MAAVSQQVLLSMLGSDLTIFAVPSIGASGGIITAWRHYLGPALSSRSDSHCASVQFCPRGGQPWWLTCVYGPQGNDNKIVFLQELRNIRAACHGPWVVVGDYN